MNNRYKWLLTVATAALAVAVCAFPAAASAATADRTRKPTIVLEHGAFADGSSWNCVIAGLRRDGYPVVAAANPLRGVASDAAALRGLIAHIDGPVILVGHSYGGSVVAVEMATAWQALGSRVTLLVREPRLLLQVERFAADLVADALRASGVDLRFDTTITAATRNGEVRFVLSDGQVLHADELLLATGCAPRTDDLGLETVGQPPGGWLPCDDTYTVPGVGGWLYAVGDVNRRALLTHQGKYQARIAGAVIAERARDHPLDRAPWSPHTGTADHVAVPQVVFTDPEIASVGLTTAEAARLARDVDVVDYDLGLVAGAHQHSPGYRGRARVLIDPDRGTILGATFAGRGVAELVQAATFAIVGEITLDRLWHAVPAFPTLSEVWLRLLETYRDTAAGTETA